MSDAPEIAPEIRGLLEEIVADPRSSIRLVPKRALRSWFERGEPVRTREVAETRAERHLIEAHREALVEVLLTASQIAYWKAPSSFAHLPIGPDGTAYEPLRQELRWVQQARSLVEREAEKGTVDLLRACLGGLESRMAFPLAEAGLALLPSDLSRLQVAFAMPQSQPRTAIMLLQRLVTSAQTRKLRYCTSLSLGARWCVVGDLREARDCYRRASELDCGRIAGFYSFHLSCCLGDKEGAYRESSEFQDVFPEAPDIIETIGVLKKWIPTRPVNEIHSTQTLVRRVSDGLPASARAILKAYLS